MTCIPLAVAVLLAPALGDLPAPSGAFFHQDVAWSPDGSRVAYSQYTAGESYDPADWAIHVADADGSHQRQVVANAFGVSWSPHGERLVFASQRDGNWELYMIKADGSGLSRLTRDPAQDRHPAWSPDSRWIAFVSDRNETPGVHVMSPDRAKVRRLTSGPGHDHNPAWSPDGRTIVFFRAHGDARDQIHTVTLDGVETRVTHDTNLNTFPSFLPDGRIAFSCKPSEGEERLFIVTPEGSGRVTVGPPDLFFARFSPDGARIAFIAGRWPRSAIYVMRSDGTGIAKIVN